MQIAEIILEVMLRALPPILLAGLGGMLTSRVGLLNMALEGMMLIGAFSAVVGSYFMNSGWAGLLFSMLIGGLLGYLFALFNIKFKANNIVVSVALNMFALGITKYLLRILFGVSGAFSSEKIQPLMKIRIPFLNDIPILRAFNNQSILVPLSFLILGVVNYVYYKTPFGLRLRGTGEHSKAVESVGVNTNRIRFAVIIVSGVLCGMAGAQLSLGQLTMFTDNMTSGRGFIAMAANIFGGSTPIGTLYGSLLFSFSDAATMRIQTLGFPAALIQTIPYLLTLITLWIVAIRNQRSKSTDYVNNEA